MNKPAGSTSLWMRTARMPSMPPLQGAIEADVCVIGAGIAGLTSAYLLARAGLKVAVLEALEVGAGETGRTTAHFFPPDERYYELERGFGKQGAALVRQSYEAATDLVARVVREEHIDCHFERLPGYLFAPSMDGWSGIEKEYRAARRAGARVQLLERVPGLAFDTGPALCFFDQAQFHPLRYLAGLADAAVRHGAIIHCATRASSIEQQGERRLVRAGNGSVTAGSVVVATNTPFHDKVSMHTKQAGYRTYVLGLRVPSGSIPKLLLWDTGDPYYYIRIESNVAPGEDVLVVGGLDHKVGQDEHPAHRYEEIERWTAARFPHSMGVAWRWSGEVMEPSDGLAFLGRDPADPRVYLITGDSGNGMTHCTAGAMLVSELIQGRDHPWASLYDPARKVTHGLGEFVREQVNTLTRYAEWLTPGEVDTAGEIAPGEGAIMRQQGKRLAVFRDEDGELHVRSATCTHLACSVAWNAAEKSWDCPCHGSRFDVDGEVLHGPATTALAPEVLEPERMPLRGRADVNLRR